MGHAGQYISLFRSKALIAQDYKTEQMLLQSKAQALVYAYTVNIKLSIFIITSIRKNGSFHCYMQ